MALKLTAYALTVTCILLTPAKSTTANASNNNNNNAIRLPRSTTLSFHPRGADSHHYRHAFVTPPPPPPASYAAYSPTPKQYNQWRITQQQQRLSRIVLAGKNKYGGENKLSQEELLLDLESKVDDYEGRIPSKVVDTGDDDDATTTASTTITSSSSPTSPHRCALVTILGLPNMGKSTLLNALLSDDLAIATSRPQTTRHAILGVMTTDRVQLCLTDTPGIIHRPAYQLQEGMMDAVKGAVKDADVFLVVVDVYSGLEKEKKDGDGDDGDGDDEDGTTAEDDLGIPEETMMKLRQAYRPVIVCVNKVDLVADDDDDDNIVQQDNGEKKKSSSVYVNTPAKAIQTIQKWRSALPDAFAILPTCAADGPNDPGVVALRSILLANDPTIDVGSAVRGLGRPLPAMFATTENNMISNEEAREILPVGPPLYHPDFFTDRTDRFCASELIRETLFENLGKELPYCCEVRVETFDESERYDGEDDEGDDDDDEDVYGVVKSNKKKKKQPLVRIGAMILVERDSQKGIVVGKGGQKIKDVGVDARRKLEEFFGVKVFLDLRVKVDKNWRNNKDKLKQFGYM